MCDVTAAVVGGSAVLGAVTSAQNRKAASGGSTTQQSGPWGEQQAPLTYGFSEARRLYENAANRAPYMGQMQADVLQDGTRSGMGRLTAYAGGDGESLVNSTSGTARNLQGATGDYLASARGLAGGIANPNSTTGTAVLDAAARGQPLAGPTTAGREGLAGQVGALGTAQGLTASGQGDINPALRQAALGYVDEARVQGQVDAALRDVSRNLNENTLPGLNARAMAGGNINSARAGTAEAVARRGAEDRASDLASGIRSEAFNTGLNAALSANQQQNNLALGGNAQAISAAGTLSGLGENQRQFDTSTRIGAAQALDANSRAGAALDLQSRVAGTNALGGAAGLGVSAAGSASTLADANARRDLTVGELQRAEQQRQLDQARYEYEAPTAYANQALQNYWNIVGSGTWGSSGQGSNVVTNPANPIGGALGGASLGMGLARSGALSGAESWFSGGGQPEYTAYNNPAAGSYGPPIPEGLYF